MIEVQVKNPTLFNKFKDSSTYHSELTKVMEFPDSMLEELKEYNVLDNSAEIEPKGDPIISIKGKTMVIDNPTLEILSFLGNRLDNDHEIAVGSMGRVRMLIYANILKVDDSFLEFYSYMDGSEKLSDLLYGAKNWRKNQNLQSALQERDGIEGDILIKDSLLMDPEMIRFKDVSYKTADIKLLSNVEPNKSGRGYNIRAVDSKNRKLYLNMYYRPTNIEKMILTKGNKTRISYSSEKSSGMQIFINTFEIIPTNMEMKMVRVYTPKTRLISADYFRVIHDEFRFRNELTEDNKLTPRLNMKSQYAVSGVFE